MTHDFLAQMALIEGRRFDAAFLPLDPRQEADYAEGFNHFMRHTDTAQAWPMHFWEDFSVFQRLADDPRSAKGGQGRMVSAISPRKPNKPKNGSALVRRCRSVFVPVMVWAVFRGG